MDRWARRSCSQPPTPLGMGAEPAFEEIAVGGDAGQQLACVSGLQDPHRAVGHALRQIGIEGDELMVQLGRVLVDRGEQRRCGRYPRHRVLHVGLVDRDLGGIDGLGNRDAVLDAGAPVLRVHGLAFPERGHAHAKRCRGIGDDPVDMAPDATARDGEAELAAIALLGDQIDPGRAQPADRQILELVADGEDPQRLAAEIGTLILWRTGKLELQRAFAGMPRRDAPR